MRRKLCFLEKTVFFGDSVTELVALRGWGGKALWLRTSAKRLVPE